VPVEKKIAAAAVSWLPKVLPAIGEWLAEQVSRVAAWFGLLAGIALVPVYCFYFLLEKQGIQRRWTDYLPIHESRTKEELVFALTAINDRLIVFFRGQVLVAACDGVIYTIGFFLVGLNYALLLGLLAGVLSIIPYLGATITFVVASILALVQFHDWLHPALVLAVFGVVQALEGLVISPKIIGDRVGLHPLTIIIAVLVGTTLLGGVLGGMLAIPLTAALRELMFRYVWKKT
jgi:predicted PurR-regulated permease PerM